MLAAVGNSSTRGTAKLPAKFECVTPDNAQVTIR